MDDEPDVLEMFSAFLTRKGYVTHRAANALEALRIVKRDEVDLVLTDYHMPEMTGMDLLIEARRIAPTIPVILMSGLADMRTATEALREQAFDFLQKPIESADLLKTLELALKRHEELAATKNETESGRGVGPIFCSRYSEDPSITVLELNRPLDEYSEKAFESAIHRLMTDGEIQKSIALGLRNVTYINNVGLNFLLRAFTDWKATGYTVVLTHLSGPVYKYLKMLGYLEYFPNTLTVQDSLTFFPSRN